eukprot:1926509-Amphidinium_carterae.1
MNIKCVLCERLFLSAGLLYSFLCFLLLNLALRGPVLEHFKSCLLLGGTGCGEANLSDIYTAGNGLPRSVATKLGPLLPRHCGRLFPIT